MSKMNKGQSKGSGPSSESNIGVNVIAIKVLSTAPSSNINIKSDLNTSKEIPEEINIERAFATVSGIDKNAFNFDEK